MKTLSYNKCTNTKKGPSSTKLVLLRVMDMAKNRLNILIQKPFCSCNNNQVYFLPKQHLPAQSQQ